MLNSTHTLVSPTPTTLERYLLEFESSMSVSFVSEKSRNNFVKTFMNAVGLIKSLDKQLREN